MHEDEHLGHHHHMKNQTHHIERWTRSAEQKKERRHHKTTSTLKTRAFTTRVINRPAPPFTRLPINCITWGDEHNKQAIALLFIQPWWTHKEDVTNHEGIKLHLSLVVNQNCFASWHAIWFKQVEATKLLPNWSDRKLWSDRLTDSTQAGGHVGEVGA